MRHISDSVLGIHHFRWAGLCWSGSFEPLRNPIHSSRITSVDLVCCDHVTYDSNYTDICCIGHGLDCWQVLWSPPWCQRCRLHAFPSPRAIWFHGRCTMWAMPIWFTICGAFLATTRCGGWFIMVHAIWWVRRWWYVAQIFIVCTPSITRHGFVCISSWVRAIIQFHASWRQNIC